jgi:DNA mismatch repair protein MutL
LRLGAGLRLEDVLRAPEGEYRVRGVLSRPLDAVSGSGRLRLLVNGRSVRDRLLLRAVRNGYGNFLKADRYPTGVVCVEVPPSEVDVNVHPQKTEIRFRTPDKIFTLLHRAVSDALARAEFLAPQSPFATSQGGSFKAPLGFVPYERGPIVFTSGQKSSEEATVETTTLVGTQQRAELRSRPGAEEGNREPGVEKALTGGVPLEQELSQSIPASSMGRSLGDPSLRSATPLQPQQMRYLGQIFRCYLLFEQGEQMVIVDMHAAHERVRFYQLKKQFLSGAIVQQLLAIPEVVELPPDQRERFLECEGDLSRLGMQCELFGEHQVAIRSTPALLRGVSPRLLLLDLLSLDESESWGGAVERVFDAVIARMACHSSVRSGQELTPQEAYALLDALNEAERSAFCPHGRPVVSALSKYELELRFGRRE